MQMTDVEHLSHHLTAFASRVCMTEEQLLGANPAIAGVTSYTILLKYILKAGRLFFSLFLYFFFLFALLFPFPAWLPWCSEPSLFQPKILWSWCETAFYRENYVLDYVNLNLFLVPNVNVWHNIVFHEMCCVNIHKQDDYCIIEQIHWQLQEQNLLILKAESCSSS